MSSKPETSFYTSVHRQLAKLNRVYLPHIEKQNNPYRGGTFDVWYSGKTRVRGESRDLWVEYKFLKQLPKRDSTMILPDLSALQLDWGSKRYEEGRDVWVILGCPEGGVIYTDLAWEEPLTTSMFKTLILDRKQIAERIVEFTCPFQ